LLDAITTVLYPCFVLLHPNFLPSPRDMATSGTFAECAIAFVASNLLTPKLIGEVLKLPNLIIITDNS
jgi:hypothetical protein